MTPPACASASPTTWTPKSRPARPDPLQLKRSARPALRASAPSISHGLVPQNQDSEADPPGTAAQQCPRRPLGQVRGVQRGHLLARPGPQPAGLPEVRLSPADRRPHAHRPPARRAGAARAVHQRQPHGSAGLPGQQALPRPAQDLPAGGGRARRGARRPGAPGRDPGRLGGHGVPLHGRLHGLGGGREDHPRRRAGVRAPPAAPRRLGLGGRPHAGGGPLADADGEDLRRPGPPARSAHPLSFDPHRSDDRWRHRLLRHARRPEHRGAGSPDRLRRAAGHRADHPAEPARGVPAQRVPGAARVPRPGGPAVRDQRDARPLPPPSVPALTTPAQILARLEPLGIQLSLEPTRDLLARLGEPQLLSTTVLVAGSNGKGSTSALLAAMGTAAGYRTGHYTSPHLETVEERLQIDGSPVEPERLGALLEEILNVAAFRWFAEENVDLAILEVGLGGRLDATNLAEPILSLVTSISLEHREFLGDTLSAIAREKAGIFRAGRPALAWVEDPEPRAALQEVAAEKGTDLRFAQDLVRIERAEREGWSGQRIRLATPGGRYDLRMTLLGAHQQRNLGLAVLAAETL